MEDRQLDAGQIYNKAMVLDISYLCRMYFKCGKSKGCYVGGEDYLPFTI
jgi:hypothetical protein